MPELTIDMPVYDDTVEVVVESMWDRKSPFWARYQELWEELVPDSGMCQTTYGEALRCIARLYYDCYNNGSCNMAGHDYFILFLREWADTREGWTPVDSLDELQRAKRRKERSDQRYTDYEDHGRGEEPPMWDGLEDEKYMKALEEIAHWVTWHVSRIQKGVEWRENAD